jgi:hypothetical protein
MVVIEKNDPVEAAEEIALFQENHAIAEQLSEIAGLLADQHAGEFRVRAYRSAAETVRTLSTPVRDILDHDGVDGLISLPTIGTSIANLIEQDLRLGRMPLLDRLRGEASAEQAFTTLPGVGPELWLIRRKCARGLMSPRVGRMDEKVWTCDSSREVSEVFL